GLPFVPAAENLVATDVEDVRVVRRDDDRVGPGKAVSMFPRAVAAGRFRPGRDQPNLVDPPVVALQRVAAAGGRADGADVDDVGVVGADGDVAAFPCAGDE